MNCDVLLSTATPLLLARHDAKASGPRHLQALDSILVDVAAGVLDRVAIHMPPRHGKSWLCSRYLPAWFLMHFPSKRVILTSYEATYAASWGDQVREVVKRCGHLTGVGIREDRSARDNWQVAGHEGGMVTAGAGGPITGMGADLLVIDDPFKNAEEAMSPTIRQKIWDWFVSTAYTRLEPGGRVVIIQTRWHEDDLIGRVLKMPAERWHNINLAALAEPGDPMRRKEGEALWPERYDAAALSRIRAADPTGYWWSAMYQGRPAPMGGGMFKRQWFRYAEKNGSPDLFKLGDAGWRNVQSARRFLTVDLAASTKETGDYTVIMAWAMFGEVLLLLDVMRARLEGPDILPQIALMLNRHSAAEAWIEKIGFQATIIQGGARLGLPVRELRPDKDKATRAAPMAAAMANAKVWFAPGAWHGDLEAELLSFPAGAHDDQVDAFAYGERVRHEVSGWAAERTALY